MTAIQKPEKPAAVGLRSERGPVLIALMLSTALVALDATILATAVPSIVGDLGSFSQFPWLFSIYLLTQAVTTPLYGKLADIVGRRRCCSSASPCSWPARCCAAWPGACPR
jgi:MFS family permease